jgi:hypothetical protein
MTTPEILWPWIPPSAFCSATRALNPAAAWLNSEEPGPVSEVIMARVIGVPVAPVPAVLPPPPPQAAAPTPITTATPSLTATLPRCAPTSLRRLQLFTRFLPHGHPASLGRLHRDGSGSIPTIRRTNQTNATDR